MKLNRGPTPKDLPTATRPRSVSSRPEEITIQNATARPRSMSVRNQSPVASRRSVVLPPDNYIPVLNADATITLPPPHELNMPLPTEPIRPDQRDDREQTYPERPTKGKSVPSSSYRGPMTPPSPSPRRDPPDPERIVPPEVSFFNFAVQKTSFISLILNQAFESRSPATYPNRPPLRRREIVMPVPLGQQLQGSSSTASNQGSVQNVLTPNITTSLRPIRTTSNTTIPGIEIETPVSFFFLVLPDLAFRVIHVIISVHKIPIVRKNRLRSRTLDTRTTQQTYSAPFSASG